MVPRPLLYGNESLQPIKAPGCEGNWGFSAIFPIISTGCQDAPTFFSRLIGSSPLKFILMDAYMVWLSQMLALAMSFLSTTVSSPDALESRLLITTTRV